MSVDGEMIIIENKEDSRVSLIYWKIGLMRNICTSPKSAEPGAENVQLAPEESITDWSTVQGAKEVGEICIVQFQAHILYIFGRT